MVGELPDSAINLFVRTCCWVWGKTTDEREGATDSGASSQGSNVNSSPAPCPDLQRGW